MLNRLLGALENQTTHGQFTYSIVVADNDHEESARATVAAFTKNSRLEVNYHVERRQNIALARNMALHKARGDFAAFIDDDEFPIAEWLLNLYRTCEGHGAAGVLGPVLPHFDSEPPRWVHKGGFYQRPRHKTGFGLDWNECRTGNVIFRRSVAEGLGEPFHPEFGTGGEDQDFFRRAIANGNRFVWCNEAVVYEAVPPARWTLRVMVMRALLRGRNSWRHPEGRWAGLGKSAVALPLYALSLPLMLLCGYHLFVKCLIRLGDHGGKVLAALGLNPIRTRDM
jgi:glycosyltransferase involved in cell wall biosynthesis